jgi:two-component system, chemotaxis family, protein-glutamate methylesterase/glutaminase
MLTGMGHDGSMSTSQLHALGAHVIAQDQETSVVWGMPGTVVAGGFADEVLPLDRIGDAIVARARKVSRSTTAAMPRPLSRPTMSHAGR